MKKFIYTLILVTTSFVTFTACTEENVTPRETPPGGNTSTTKGA